MALSDAFDMEFTLKHESVSMLSFRISLSMMTDIKSLYNVITRVFTRAEERIMIDLWTVKNAYTSFDENDVALIRSNFNIADALTKLKTSCVFRESKLNGKYISLDWAIEYSH